MKIKHLGLIPDGNRRWAKEHDTTNRVAYDLFSKHICDIILATASAKIEMLTIYIVSKENLTRTEQDVSDVLEAVYVMFAEDLPVIVDNLHAQIRCIGIDTIADKALKKIMVETEARTKGNNGIIVNLLIGYNPVDEIRNTIMQGKEICIENLSVPKCVDLLIRTAGGPIRLSNFLPLQCGYANIEVIEHKFLDVTCAQIVDTIHRYRNIEPNYGK